MFRRFMIVCWVLFGAPFLVATVAAVFYFPSYDSMKEFISKYGADGEGDYSAEFRIDEQIQETRRRIALSNEMLARIDNGTWTGETSMEAARQTRDDASDQLTRLVVDKMRYEDAKRSATVSLDIGGPAVVMAAIMLLWNIIWQVGHWVWMGHKETGN